MDASTASYLTTLTSLLDSSLSSSLSGPIAAAAGSCGHVLSKAVPLADHHFQKALEAHGHVVAKTIDRPIYGGGSGWKGVSSYYEEEGAAAGPAGPARGGEKRHDFEYKEPAFGVRVAGLDEPGKYAGMELGEAVGRVGGLTGEVEELAERMAAYGVNGGGEKERESEVEGSFEEEPPFSYDLDLGGESGEEEEEEGEDEAVKMRVLRRSFEQEQLRRSVEQEGQLLSSFHEHEQEDQEEEDKSTHDAPLSSSSSSSMSERMRRYERDRNNSSAAAAALAPSIVDDAFLARIRSVTSAAVKSGNDIEAALAGVPARSEAGPRVARRREERGKKTRESLTASVAYSDDFESFEEEGGEGEEGGKGNEMDEEEECIEDNVSFAKSSLDGPLQSPSLPRRAKNGKVGGGISHSNGIPRAATRAAAATAEGKGEKGGGGEVMTRRSKESERFLDVWASHNFSHYQEKEKEPRGEAKEAGTRSDRARLREERVAAAARRGAGSKGAAENSGGRGVRDSTKEHVAERILRLAKARREGRGASKR